MPGFSRDELERIEAAENLRKHAARVIAALIILAWFVVGILKGCQ